MNKFSFRISFGDTDPFGVAYFASYLDYCKKALDEWIRNKGIKPEDFYRNKEKGWGFPVIEISCRYFSPVKYDEEIIIEVYLKEVTDKDVKFLFEIKNLKGEKRAEAEIKLRCVSREFKSIFIPKEVRKYLV